MRKSTLLVTMTTGMALGYVAASVVRPQLVEARTWPTVCSVSKSTGTLRTARGDGWLFFEDSAGVIRGVDTDCKVRIIVNRE
jgi:hypothetical protein